MKYQDKLQMRIEAQLLRGYQTMATDDQVVGYLMLTHNIFYDEAKSRYEQARLELKI